MTIAFKSDLFSAAIQTGLFYLVFFGVCSLVVAACGLFIEGLYERWVARGQKRAVPRPLQPFYDIVKLMRKETLVPAGANRGAFLTMPLVALAAACLASTILVGNVLWQNGVLPRYGFVGDSLVVTLLLLAPTVALVFGASCSNNPFGAVAASRNLRLLSCGLPLVLAVVSALVLACGAERRLVKELDHQVDTKVSRRSPLHSRRRSGPGATAVAPLRISEMLVLRGAGPDTEDKLLKARAIAKLRRGRDGLREAYRRARPGYRAAWRRLEPLEKQYDKIHEKGELPSAELERRVERARAAFERERAPFERLKKNYEDAVWLAGSSEAQRSHVSARRLREAAEGRFFARRAGLLISGLCVLVAVFCGMALTGRPPFEFAEGDRNLAGGALVEYGGPLLAVWRLARAMMLVAVPVFIGLMFMNGFRFSVPDLAAVEWRVLFSRDGGGEWRILGLNMLQAFVSLLKFFLVVYAFALLRRAKWRPKPGEVTRFFFGTTSLIAFCALFVAVVLLWASR